ncbi:hypothetical protein MRX96_040749 [Rhipicephalus microplus]
MRQSCRQCIRSRRAGVKTEGIPPVRLPSLPRSREGNPLVAGPSVDDHLSHTSHKDADHGLPHHDGLLISHRRLGGSGGEETRGAHLCRSTERAARESIGDFVAQSRHVALLRRK